MKTVYLVGVGMGNPETLTLEAKKAVEASGLLLGAPRLLEQAAHLPGEKRPLVRTEEIAQAAADYPGNTVAVLLSGDPGFYSGAAGLYERLKGCQVITIPGISSLNYFCAKLHTSWQDVKLLSAHGRACNVAGEVRTHRKTFLLTGGKSRGEDICRLLTQEGLGGLTVHLGERLSYPDERIVTGRAEELAQDRFQDLTVMLVENPFPIPQYPCAVGIGDEELIRGKVPMTKETVRTAAVSKLGLSPESVVWDVGAGTGSVSVACALTARKGKVYAVEKNPEALALLEANREKFGVTNLAIVPGEAPEVLKGLPRPDRVFIGGSSGSMEGIFRAALEKNPSLRILVTAASLESFTGALTCFKEFGLEKVDVTQITAAQARALGRYHMMTGQNPVWLISGEGRP